MGESMGSIRLASFAPCEVRKDMAICRACSRLTGLLRARVVAISVRVVRINAFFIVCLILLLKG